MDQEADLVLKQKQNFPGWSKILAESQLGRPSFPKR